MFLTFCATLVPLKCEVNEKAPLFMENVDDADVKKKKTPFQSFF